MAKKPLVKEPKKSTLYVLRRKGKRPVHVDHEAQQNNGARHTLSMSNWREGKLSYRVGFTPLKDGRLRADISQGDGVHVKNEIPEPVVEATHQLVFQGAGLTHFEEPSHHPGRRMTRIYYSKVKPIDLRIRTKKRKK